MVKPPSVVHDCIHLCLLSGLAPELCIDESFFCSGVNRKEISGFQRSIDNRRKEDG
jgi:hypothetical protein